MRKDESPVGPSGHRRRRTRPVLLLDALVAVVVLAGLAGLAFGRLSADDPPPVRVSGTLSTPTASTPRAHPATVAPRSPALTGVSGSVPLRLSIPAIGVATRLVRLGLNPDGSLEVPTDFSVAGWYALGPSPGEPGAAVIVGHVDSKQGPAVFYRLGELAPGSLVHIALADLTEVLFRVYAVQEYPKAAFPTSLVYGATPAPELRLVTCGGPFDEKTGHYLDNVIVFASDAGPGAALLH